MKRSEALEELSRDHHVALGHSLRLRRCTTTNLAEVVAAFLAFLTGPGREHFEQEEEILAPEVPSSALHLVTRMSDEHAEIMRLGGMLGAEPDVDRARGLGSLLNAHVRFEERELFPVVERSLSPARLREIAARLSRARA